MENGGGGIDIMPWNLRIRGIACKTPSSLPPHRDGGRSLFHVGSSSPSLSVMIKKKTIMVNGNAKFSVSLNFSF
ncbi:hypothetical protein A2U01_0004099 [Trifolium medium]|uniref:Uncharacterized protein n=1 Tax=Trifolium medium TaxID=97028 RepID=A0A392M749_9FABA|nr:hypothetical protein [Trifolium medium]